MSIIKLKIATITSQIYILPTVKITYDRWLNSDLELIIGWLKWELIIAI